MLCIKCGQDNPPGTKYCEKCNATMIDNLPESTTTSVIDVEEGQKYLTPEKNYECQWFTELMFMIHLYTQGEADLDEVIDVYESVVKIYESFEKKELPDFFNELDEWRHNDLGKEYSRQMTYLLTKGFQLIREGLNEIKPFLVDGEDKKAARSGLEKVQDGVNQLGLAAEFLGVHRQIMEEELSRRMMESRAEEFKTKTEAKKETISEENGE